MGKIIDFFTGIFGGITYFFQKFLPEVKAEWKKVTRPSRPEVVATTIVVIITSVIFAAYLWGADQVIIFLYNGLLNGLDKLGVM